MQDPGDLEARFSQPELILGLGPLCYRAQGLGFRVYCLGRGIWGLAFLGFMASGLGCMATSGESQMEKGLKHEET